MTKKLMMMASTSPKLT
uniref:Uncharacterized protein n=1 Tax=Arundo donax TaxID=35708 RepID=A0A0A9EUS0_ARUDO